MCFFFFLSSVSELLFFLATQEWKSSNSFSSLFQDIKSKKTKGKKGEVTDGKKKAKKEPEEKWKWWVAYVVQLSDAFALVIGVVMGRLWMYCVQLWYRLIFYVFRPLVELYCNLTDCRWEEERYTDGVKWKFLEHKGPVFAPPYEPVPSHVKFYYDGEIMFVYIAQCMFYNKGCVINLHECSCKFPWLINTSVNVYFR